MWAITDSFKPSWNLPAWIKHLRRVLSKENKVTNRENSKQRTGASIVQSVWRLG